MIYLPPVYKNTDFLKENDVIVVRVVDLNLLENQKWGAEQNVRLVEIVFEDGNKNIVTQKFKYSLAKDSDINGIYRAVNGVDVDSNRGFYIKDILQKDILADVDSYTTYNGKKVKTLKNFRPC